MATPVWLKAVTTREGADIVTRCCVVTEGQYFPIEVRVNVPRLAASLRSLGLAGDETDGVSGFGSWLKKAVKSVTKSKVVKAVGKVVGKVARSPIVQIANPMLAISSHTISKAATGKGTIKGPAGKLVDAGSSLVTKVAPIPNVMSFVSPKAAAALGVGLKAVTTARAGSVIASVAKQAQGQVNLGKAAAQSLLQKTASNPAAAKALVERAVQVRSNVQKSAPALAKRVVQSSRVKASIAAIAAKAKAGSADAHLAASVIARSAAALDQVSRLQQASAGGVAGLLVTSDGRILRAPRGRFTLRASAAARPDVLYRGPKDPALKGLFAAVAGAGWAGIGASPSWGGDLDPGNDIDGPLADITPPGGRVWLEDYSQVAGLLTP